MELNASHKWFHNHPHVRLGCCDLEGFFHVQVPRRQARVGAKVQNPVEAKKLVGEYRYLWVEWIPINSNSTAKRSIAPSDMSALMCGWHNHVTVWSVLYISVIKGHLIPILKTSSCQIISSSANLSPRGLFVWKVLPKILFEKLI